jgi:CheY-like chemotaxis protein
VLVIDDEESVRMVASRMLERRGFHVLLAADGLAGLRIFDEQASSIQLVLLDLSMSGMNGAETLARLRQRAPVLPVVLMSGFAEDDARRRFAQLGIAAFLQKPFTFVDLITIVQRALGLG